MKYVLSKMALAAAFVSIVVPASATSVVDDAIRLANDINTTRVASVAADTVVGDVGDSTVPRAVDDTAREVSDDNVNYATEEPTPIIIIRPNDETIRSKKGWLAEQLAVTAFGDSLQYWQAASENDGEMPSDTRNNLADIGRSYTSNNLPALGVLDDFLVFIKNGKSSSAEMNSGDDKLRDDTADTAFTHGYAIGDIYTPALATKKTVKGVFTTYHEKHMDITVYTGPDKSRLTNHQLRGQGATYLYPVGAITNIHTTDKQASTVRDVGIGTSRMEMIFAYGSPNAMWRNSSDESYIFLYKSDNEKVWNEKKEFTPVIANTNNNSQSKRAIEKGVAYIAFTIKKNNIESIDIIDGQVWPRFGLPTTDMYDFKAGQLTEDDFVLRGLHLNQKFSNDSNSEWRTQGMLFGSSFIGYNEYGVSVDKASLINRVLLNIYTPTRRGISIGDTKYLLLFVYGMPTRIVESSTDNGTATVYEYKNPRSNTSYLQFALDDKNQYIKSVMLSDRPVK